MTLFERIKLAEEFRAEAYEDTTRDDGIVRYSIGFGRNSSIPFRGTIDEATAEQWLREDLQIAANDARTWLGDKKLWRDTAGPRTDVLTEMSYQLGAPSLGAFTEFRRAYLREDWDAAAAAILDSKLAREDTPERAKRYAETMRNGEYPDLHN